MINVLVVEKDWRMRELLMNVLADAGYSVDEASDGKLAAERAREHRPDIVVFNRETCALEFLAAGTVKPLVSGVAVVVASSRPRPLAGAAVYLKKPFTMDDLLAALQRCLERTSRPSVAYAIEQTRSDAT